MPIIVERVIKVKLPFTLKMEVPSEGSFVAVFKEGDTMFCDSFRWQTDGTLEKYDTHTDDWYECPISSISEEALIISGDSPKLIKEELKRDVMRDAGFPLDEEVPF